MSEQQVQGADQALDLNNELQSRREKLAGLRENGIAFPNDFRRDSTSDKLHAAYGDKDNEELEALGVEVTVAGRMMTRRIMGKASFVTLQDVGGRIQLYVARAAELLREGGPWGQAFPEPTFDGKFRILQQRLVGEKHLKLMVEPLGGGPLLDGIAFNVDTTLWPDSSVREVELAYKLDVNEFRGNRNVQLLIQHLWPR